MITVSQAAIVSVLTDIRTMQETGVTPEYVKTFNAARPEWSESQDEQATLQEDDRQEAAAQA